MPAGSYSAQSTEIGRSEATVPQALALPVIEDAFARHRHPYWPELQASSRTWLLERRLMTASQVDRFADSLRYTDLVAGYYVGASDEVLTAIADFSTWFFVWDDRHDRDAVHSRDRAWALLRDRLRAALEDPAGHLDQPDPLVAAFAESIGRLLGRLGPEWDVRFVRHFHGVIDAYEEEFGNRRDGRVPDVAAYVELRRRTFGHRVWLDLMELAAGHPLPEQLRRHPAVQRAALACQDFSAWYNDLCSLPKEIAGDELHNLGISLIHHEGLSLEEAVVEVRKRVRRCTAEFLAAEVRVTELAEEWGDSDRPDAAAVRESLLSCLFNMRNWFSSVYWFHHESGRYRVESWDDSSTPPYLSELAGEE